MLPTPRANAALRPKKYSLPPTVACALSQVAGYVRGVAPPEHPQLAASLPSSDRGRLPARPANEESAVTAVRAETTGPHGPAAPIAPTAASGARSRVGDGYTARHLSVLEGLEAVRKRPGMYIGSTDGRGLMHCLWEIFDNSVDEALAGHCTEIEIVLYADSSAEVRDNGRGIPVDVGPRTGLTGIELVMTRLHAGGKFGGGSYTASGGLHGVGASVVNALSARLDVEVDREGTSGPWPSGEAFRGNSAARPWGRLHGQARAT